jgi:hypothetical protein
MASARRSSMTRDAVVITAIVGAPFMAIKGSIARLLELYHASGEDLFYRFDGHLNHRGNAAVADHLSAAFVERFADRLRVSPGGGSGGARLSDAGCFGEARPRRSESTRG